MGSRPAGWAYSSTANATVTLEHSNQSVWIYKSDSSYLLTFVCLPPAYLYNWPPKGLGWFSIWHIQSLGHQLQLFAISCQMQPRIVPSCNELAIHFLL